MRLGLVLLCAGALLSAINATAQDAIRGGPATEMCIQLRRSVLDRFAEHGIKEAEAALPAVMDSATAGSDRICTAWSMYDLAAVLSVSGRLSESEKFAERSVRMLDEGYKHDDPALVRPLQVLTAIRFELGKTARAREAFQRLQSIRIERPENRAAVHSLGGALLEAEGRLPEAELEYSAAIGDWQQCGRADTADAGAVLTAVGSLHVKQGRYVEARQALDRALAVFAGSNDTVVMDRVKALNVRASLHAKQGEWQDASRDLTEAISISRGDGGLDSAALASVLTRYAYVLRKLHRKAEARSIEVQVVTAGSTPVAQAVVDVTEFRSGDSFGHKHEHGAGRGKALRE